MECVSFKKAAGSTWEEKAKEACASCAKCKGNFPLNPDDAVLAASESEQVIFEIKEIVSERKSGFAEPIDDLFTQKLVLTWERAEREINEIRAIRIQNFIRAHFKE